MTSSNGAAVRTIGWHYEHAHARIDGVTRGLTVNEWASAVPACPGWRVDHREALVCGGRDDRRIFNGYRLPRASRK